jgi:hypothetical protein
MSSTSAAQRSRTERDRQQSVRNTISLAERRRRRDAERAETKRLLDKGKLIEYEANPEPSNKD